MLSFLPYTFYCYVRLFLGFFHKHKSCQNSKFSINHAVYCVSNPSPKYRITNALNPIKCIRKSNFTYFKLAHTLDVLRLRYLSIVDKISLGHDATQPRGTSEEDDSHACTANTKGISVRGRRRFCPRLLGANTTYRQTSGVLKTLCLEARPGHAMEGHRADRLR